MDWGCTRTKYLEENGQKKSEVTETLTKLYNQERALQIRRLILSYESVQANEMGRIKSTHEGNKKDMQNFIQGFKVKKLFGIILLNWVTKT